MIEGGHVPTLDNQAQVAGTHKPLSNETRELRGADDPMASVLSFVEGGERAEAIFETASTQYCKLDPKHRYSALIPASLTTFSHFSVSARMNLPNSAGFLRMASAPCDSNLFRMSGFARIPAISRSSCSIMQAAAAIACVDQICCSTRNGAVKASGTNHYIKPPLVLILMVT